jgi:non-specific serine/threonine protein kinase
MPLTPLLGRDAEVAAACALLARGEARLLTLVGPGGIGKTRLALQVAAESAAAFDDQVGWAPVAMVTTPEAVATTLAQAAGSTEAAAAPPVEALKAALREARLLLVVDNFEQALDAAPLLGDLLGACPGLALLVTSRALLRITGERALDVPSLATLPQPAGPGATPEVAPAVRLFAQRAVGVLPAFALTPESVPVVTEICRRLDGLPLAIELAAARANHLPLPDLRDRLGRRLALLTTAARDVPDRHRTMRAAIAWSYDLLSGDARALFRRLAVFSGGFTLDAAEAVGGEATGESRPSTAIRSPFDRRPLPVDSVASALDLLGSLVDKSLVRYEPVTPGGPRYVLLETVREFAAEQLAESGEEAKIRDTHAAYVVALAEWAKPALETPAAAAWAARLEAEHGNVLAALGWLEAAGRGLDLLRLAYAMVNVWGISLRLREARDWLERALDPGRSAGAPPALRAGAAWGLGWIALCLGDADNADAWLGEALAIRRGLGDALGVAHTLTVLGRLAEHRGDDADAQARYAEALAGFRAAGHLPGIAWSLVAQADAAYRRGEVGEAARLAEEAVAVARESGHQHQLADALVSVGGAAATRADWGPAVAALRQALDLGRDLGSRMVCAAALTCLAEVAVAAGEAGRAARLLGAIAALTEAGGLAKPERSALHSRALAAARGALDEQRFAAAWAAGRALAMEEAIAEGLAVEPPATATRVPPSRGQGESLLASADPPGLSPRELDVLRLLPGGLSDREIAEALFIGERTVNTHVARIFEKLGVRNRAAAAAAAVAAGLLDPAAGTDPPDPRTDPA